MSGKKRSRGGGGGFGGGRARKQARTSASGPSSHNGNNNGGNRPNHSNNNNPNYEPSIEQATALPTDNELNSDAPASSSQSAGAPTKTASSSLTSGHTLLRGPAPPNLPKTPAEKESWKRTIVVLEMACLEAAKLNNKFELLNADDHTGFLKNNNKDSSIYRPDIVHQCLLQLMDSPLNKSGHLQVFIHTRQDVLIEVHPSTRIPRTYKRFAGLMVQLLHKMSIRASVGSEKLLRVIKNPVTNYFPPGVRVIGTSFSATTLVDCSEFVKNFDPEKPIVWVIGTQSHGKVEVDYTDIEVSMSAYPLSAAVACGRVTYSYEMLWGLI